MSHSGIYRGTIRHRRFRPRHHAFSYRLFMMYLDLAELEGIFKGRWLWSARGPALAWFRREDHLGDPRRPLDDCVRDLVVQETGRRPQGPIRLLTHLRYFGYCFNPISIYYCFDEADERIETLVAEVTNTPWGERRCYVLNNPAITGDVYRYRFAKEMHVSPFMPMDLDYDWRCHQPGKRLAVHMDVLRQEEKLFDATLALAHQPITGPALAGILVRHPVMTLKVIAAIHWQALRLWLKRIPVCAHPPKRDSDYIKNTHKPTEGQS